MRLFVLALLTSLLALGCSHRPTARGPSPRTTPFAVEPGNDDALLWNGLIGVRISRDGTAKEGANTLPFFAIDDYSTTDEEKILRLPNPVLPVITIDSNELHLGSAPDYVQSLDEQTGILTMIGTCDGVQVKCETVVHPSQRKIAQQWTLRSASTKRVSFEVAQAKDPTAKSKDFFINNILCSDYQLPDGLPNRAMAIRVLADSAGAKLKVGPGKQFRGQVVWSLGPSRNWPKMMAARGVKVPTPAGWDQAPTPGTYDEVCDTAKRIWAKRWETDIEIDGPEEDQRAVRSFIYHLRSAIAPGGDMGLNPFGLSNYFYLGHVFWDQDVWVFPALALIDPDAAKEIPDYRLAMADGARKNYLQWIKAGRPMAHLKLGPSPPGDGIMYPWESSVSGGEMVIGHWNDTHGGPTRNEMHVTGSVLWGLEQAAALGLADPEQVGKIGRQAATFYLQRSRKRPDGTYEMPWVMSPDENHVGGNDLYTNLLAKHTLDTYAPERFPNGFPIVLPHDERSFLTYDGDRVSNYKQAAAILAIYPLQNPLAEQEAPVMMKRFPSKVKDTGPAMSRSVDALIWARMGKMDEAYVAWHQSWQDFVKPPLMLFAEKRQVPVTYFTTGAAGSLQTVLYGFLGFRIDSQEDPAAGWSKKLIGERWLTIKPNLPKAWKSVKFKNFRLMGHRYTLFATHSGVTVTQGD